MGYIQRVKLLAALEKVANSSNLKNVYHGTENKQSAEKIWDEGLKSNQPSSGDHGVSGLKGHVYLTSDIFVALQYAFSRFDYGPERKGYIFVIDKEKLTPEKLNPDEDNIGRAIRDKKFKWLDKLAKKYLNVPANKDFGEYDEDDKEDEGFDLKLYARVKKGYEWKRAAKIILPHLSQSQKFQIMKLECSEMGMFSYQNFSYKGKVFPSEMWELSRKNRDEFFKFIKNKKVNVEAHFWKFAKLIHKR